MYLKHTLDIIAQKGYRELKYRGLVGATCGRGPLLVRDDYMQQRDRRKWGGEKQGHGLHDTAKSR